MISLCIVTHRHPRHGLERLKALLAMVERQSHEPDEVIIVADDDIRPEVPFGQIIVSQSRQIDHKRNLAYAYANHDTLVWMDDDDVYGPHYIRSQVEHLDRTGSPAIIRAWHPLIYDLAGRRYARWGFVCGPAMAFRKEFLVFAGAYFRAPNRPKNGGDLRTGEGAHLLGVLASLGLGWSYTRAFCESEDFIWCRWPESTIGRDVSQLGEGREETTWHLDSQMQRLRAVAGETAAKRLSATIEASATGG